MLENNIVLVGYSGHGLVVADSIESLGAHKLIGYVDRQKKVFNPFELEYFGSETPELFSRLTENNLKVILGIGDNNIRKQVFEIYQSKKIEFINVIDSTSLVSEKSKLGIGNFISRNAVINSFSTISNNCIINTGCIIEHECLLESHIHIAPGAVLCGNIQLGESSFIGANSVIKQGVIIGKNVTIGAGSVVLKNIYDNEVWVGNPAKRIK